MEATKIDLWELWDLFEARQLPCSSFPVFLDYLYSPGAQEITMDGGSVVTGSANFRLVGPRTDDGGQLYVKYRLTKEEVRMFLDAGQRADLSARLKGLGLKGNALELARAALGLSRVR